MKSTTVQATTEKNEKKDVLCFKETHILMDDNKVQPCMKKRRCNIPPILDILMTLTFLNISWMMQVNDICWRHVSHVVNVFLAFLIIITTTTTKHKQQRKHYTMCHKCHQCALD